MKRKVFLIKCRVSAYFIFEIFSWFFCLLFNVLTFSNLFLYIIVLVHVRLDLGLNAGGISKNVLSMLPSLILSC